MTFVSYNFDEIIDRRHTNALNTDGFRGYIFHADADKKFPYKDEEFVRMWVADMEFGTAPEIIEALRERVDDAYSATPRFTTTDITTHSPHGAKATMIGASPRRSFA